MYGYIYMTTNLVNGKRYIGQHKALKKDPKYIGSGVKLTKDIKKYGPENFSNIILQWCKSDWELNTREKAWILMYNAVNDPDFYNLSPGGHNFMLDSQRGTNNPSCKISEEIVLKILESKKNGLTYTQISEKYKVSKSTISHILNGDAWSYLTGIHKEIRYKKQGIHHPMCKLSEKEVMEIVSYKGKGLIQKKIAEMFQVDRSLIGYIWSGKIWSHITGIKYERK